jgi:deoxyribodipyrimidine photolyase-related protein
MSKTALLLFQNQLFAPDFIPAVDEVYVIEDPYFYGADEDFEGDVHKHKIILQHAAVRRYVEECLWPRGFKVEFIEFEPGRRFGEAVARMREGHVSDIYFFDVLDDIVSKRLQDAAEWATLHMLEPPSFLLNRTLIKQYLAENGSVEFPSFYRWVRERKNILLTESGGPLGGAWMYDDTKHKALEADHVPPGLQSFGNNEFVNHAYKIVEENFPNNYGTEENFIWPTNHHEALLWLHNFLDTKLDYYRDYRNTFQADMPFLYHSILSPVLGIGLLTPQQIIDVIMTRHRVKPYNAKLIETFIRDVIGYREYAHMLYLSSRNKLVNSNEWNHKRRMTDAWRAGETGVVPFDVLIKKVQSHGYATTVERSQIAGMLMFLCEIFPADVNQFFLELFIDGYEWATIPNVYGLSQCADGGNLVPILPIANSRMLIESGAYPKGEWTDIWDGLYIRFVQNNRTELLKMSAMKSTVKHVDEMDADRKRILGYRAEDFLTNFTVSE